MNLLIADLFDPNEVIAQVGESIAGYVDTLPLGETLHISRLTQVAFNASAGVRAVPYVRINGVANDLPATRRNKIITGAVTVS